jgi:hypothetical protein
MHLDTTSEVQYQNKTSKSVKSFYAKEYHSLKMWVSNIFNQTVTI